MGKKGKKRQERRDRSKLSVNQKSVIDSLKLMFSQVSVEAIEDIAWSFEFNMDSCVEILSEMAVQAQDNDKQEEEEEVVEDEDDDELWIDGPESYLTFDAAVRKFSFSKGEDLIEEKSEAVEIDVDELAGIFAMFPDIGKQEIEEVFQRNGRNAIKTLDELLEKSPAENNLASDEVLSVHSASSYSDDEFNQSVSEVKESENVILLRDLFPDISALFIKEVLEFFKGNSEDAVNFILQQQASLLEKPKPKRTDSQVRPSLAKKKSSNSSPWKEAVSMQRSSTRFQDIIDEEIAHKLSYDPNFEMQNQNSETRNSTKAPAPTISSAFDTRQNLRQNSVVPNSISAKLKLEALHKAYPKLSFEEIAILFRECNGNFQMTSRLIQVMHPQFRKESPDVPYLSIEVRDKSTDRNDFEKVLNKKDKDMHLWKGLQNLRRSAESPSKFDYRDIREEAFELANQRNDLFQRARKAFSDGIPEYGYELLDRVKAINEMMKDAHQAAMVATFNSHNRHIHDPSVHAVDLHGLHVTEAINMLELVIHEKKRQGIKHLRVITGAGKHSGKRGAKLLPAVFQYLRSHNIGHSQTSPGEFKIVIP
jgi:DNA-nicking Smr family endonuclease